MEIIVSKFIVSVLVGTFLGFISVKGTDKNPLSTVWVLLWLFTIATAFIGLIMFVFGEQLPWSQFTLKDWLRLTMLAGYFFGGLLTYWFETH